MHAAPLLVLLAVTAPVAAADAGRAAEAARTAATSDTACAPSKVGDFYWEIGDGNRVLASGSQGRGRVDADTTFAIASASKLVFGAYVLEKKGFETVQSNPSLRDGLRFTSGYTDFKPRRCFGERTVGGCYGAGFRGRATPNPRTAGHFYYQSGHNQKLAAVDMGLASLDAEQLMREIGATLRLDPAITMAPRAVLLAGGMQGNARAYADFLRRIVRRELTIGSHLGADAVCAQPGTCPAEAESSPLEGLGEPWSYSYNHWVESEHAGIVDAYSSAGAFGFYPWISADGRYYGVLSRHDRKARAAVASVMCGRAIRKAFLSALRD